MIAAANGVAVHPCDDRLQAVLDTGVGVEVGAAPTALLLDLGQPLDVTAGAECAVARTSQDDYAHAVISVGVLDRLPHLCQRFPGEGIHHLGPVDGDPRSALDAMVLLVKDVLES